LNRVEYKITAYTLRARKGEQGMMLNIGCGNNAEGEVRLDIKPTHAVNIIADAHYLPFRSLFQKIKCHEVLEHLKSPVIALKEMKRVLTKGFISIKVPNVIELKRTLAHSKNPLRPINPNTHHLQGWDACEIKHLVTEVGGLQVNRIMWVSEGKREKFNWLNGILRHILPPVFYCKEMLVILQSIPCTTFKEET
jgi:SAM-dependent methyltransferase